MVVKGGKTNEKEMASLGRSGRERRWKTEEKRKKMGVKLVT